MDDEEKRRRYDRFIWKSGDIQLIRDSKGGSKEHREKASVQDGNGAIKDVWKEGDFTRVVFEKDATSSAMANSIKDLSRKSKNSGKKGQ